MEQLAPLVMLSTFVAVGEGVPSQGTAYLPGDTVIDVVAPLALTDLRWRTSNASLLLQR